MNSFTYTLGARVQRVWNGADAPWLVTFQINTTQAIGTLAWPQTYCVIDDFGNLVMVVPIL